MFSNYLAAFRQFHHRLAISAVTSPSQSIVVWGTRSKSDTRYCTSNKTQVYKQILHLSILRYSDLISDDIASHHHLNAFLAFICFHVLPARSIALTAIFQFYRFWSEDSSQPLVPLYYVRLLAPVPGFRHSLFTTCALFFKDFHDVVNPVVHSSVCKYSFSF